MNELLVGPAGGLLGSPELWSRTCHYAGGAFCSCRPMSQAMAALTLKRTTRRGHRPSTRWRSRWPTKLSNRQSHRMPARQLARIRSAAAGARAPFGCRRRWSSDSSSSSRQSPRSKEPEPKQPPSSTSLLRARRACGRATNKKAEDTKIAKPPCLTELFSSSGGLVASGDLGIMHSSLPRLQLATS